MRAIDKIMRTKLEAEFDSSVDMAIERGSFKGFDPAIENESEFIKMMQEEFPELYSRMMEHRSEEHTSELQSLMRISYAVFCLKQNTVENKAQNTVNNDETV